MQVRDPTESRSAVAFGLVIVGLATSVQAASSQPTYNGDVAAILDRSCVECHRGGDVAPFPLTGFDQVRPRARSIARAVLSGEMPPWKPSGGVPLQDDRSLSQREIETLVAWSQAGAPRGDDASRPTPPIFPDGWRLGAPDAVLELPAGFEVPARSDGDLFRNFVLDLRPFVGRHLKALELRPLSRGVVHHATILSDASGEARRLDQIEELPGFPGMARGVAPGGHFFGWTPGRTAAPLPDGMAWTIPPDTDLVVQFHLVPTGTPEPVSAEIGLFFSDRAPTRLSATVHLTTTEMSIPAGEPAYAAQDSLVLPVDVLALSIYPHMHTIGESVRLWQTPPDGVRSLIFAIDDWDFAWQDQYRFSTPLQLAAGTLLEMELVWDNAAAADGSVRWGPRSEDEMGDVWLQVVPASVADARRLVAEIESRDLEAQERGYRRRLTDDPRDWEASNRLGQLAMSRGRADSAVDYFTAALEVRPDLWHLYDSLGMANLRLGRMEAAKTALATATDLQADQPVSWNNLGTVLLTAGQAEDAAAAFGRALELQPDNAQVRINRGVALARLGRWQAAVDDYAQALMADPSNAEGHNNLASAWLELGREQSAEVEARRAIELRSDYVDAYKNLATAVARSGRTREAVAALRIASRLAPDDFGARFYLGVGLAELGQWQESMVELRVAKRLDPEDPNVDQALQAVADRLAAIEN